MINITVTWLV